MSDQKQTTDHKAIQSFAEENNLKPARVKESSNGDLIRLMQPSSPASENDKLEEISWNKWFEAFEENDLALVYEAGDSKDFNKLVSRN